MQLRVVGLRRSARTRGLLTPLQRETDRRFSFSTWLMSAMPRLDYPPAKTGAQGIWHGYGTAPATLTAADQPRKARL